MTIDDIKRALVEVSGMCKENKDCNDCPFDKNTFCCPINDFPERWRIDDWKEDAHGSKTD